MLNYGWGFVQCLGSCLNYSMPVQALKLFLSGASSGCKNKLNIIFLCRLNIKGHAAIEYGVGFAHEFIASGNIKQAHRQITSTAKFFR